MAWDYRPPSTPRPGSYWENIRTRFPGIQASLTRGNPGGVGGYTRPGTIQQGNFQVPWDGRQPGSGTVYTSPTMPRTLTPGSGAYPAGGTGTGTRYTSPTLPRTLTAGNAAYPAGAGTGPRLGYLGTRRR